MTSTTVAASKELAQLLNCTEVNTNSRTIMQCLKRIAAYDLFAAYAMITTYSWFGITFAPIVDDDLFKDDPINILKDTESQSYSFFRSLDILIGTNSADSSTFLPIAAYIQDKFNFNITEGIPKGVLCDFLAPQISAKYYKHDSKVTKAICQKYGNAVDVKNLSLDTMDAFLDFVYFVPAVQSLRIHGRGYNEEGSRYHYQFSRPSPTPLFRWVVVDWLTGAYHADDLSFEFPFFDLQTPDRSIAFTVMKYWTNFAKNGNVNGEDLPEWKQYDDVNGHYIDIDFNTTTGTHLFKDRVNFWLTDIPAILQEGSAGPTSGFYNYKPKCINKQLLLVTLTLFLLNI